MVNANRLPGGEPSDPIDMDNLDRVDTLDGLLETLKRENGKFEQILPSESKCEAKLFCTRCQDWQRVTLQSLSRHPGFGFIEPLTSSLMSGQVATPDDKRLPVPSAGLATCFKCKATWILLVHESNGEKSLTVIASKPGGVSTAHSPTAVSTYLAEAWIARHSGAPRAALAMYRSAAEAFLFHQGFNRRMLGPKLQELQAAIAAGTAPTWVGRTDPHFLTVINELAKPAIHGDLDEHGEPLPVDDDLLHNVEVALLEILDQAYEFEARTKQRLDKLKGTS